MAIILEFIKLNITFAPFHNKIIVSEMRKNYLLSFITAIFLFAVFTPSKVNAQFEFKVVECTTYDEVIALIDTVFLSGVSPQSIRNISFTGDPKSVGYFYNGYFTGFQRPEGIIMTSGYATYADKSNVCSTEQNASQNLGLPGDDDLTTLANNGFSSQDACIIEFDFKPAGDTVKFNYVFASEEYHEYVNANFNDVFGFFLAGDGIHGSFSDSAINIAEIPGTHIPVAINNVNFGKGGVTCTGKPTGCTHCEYFKDNSQSDDPAFNIFVYDGLTTKLVADNEVTQCKWYHIKLAIGDVGDHIYDSGVLLEKGSFDPGNVVEQTDYTHPTVDSLLYESCNNHEAILYFRIGSLRNSDYKIPFHIDTTSTATRDVDYSLYTTHPGDTIVIGAGTLMDSIRIKPYLDNLVEGIEDINLIFNSVMCGFGVPDTVTIYIADLPEMPDTNLIFSGFCEDTVNLSFNGIIGGAPPYSFNWYTENKTTSTVNYIPSGNNSFFVPVVINDTCGQQVSDTAFVIVPALVPDAGPVKSMCNVDSVQLEGDAPGAQEWLWSSIPFDPSLSGKEDSLQPWVYPNAETMYLLDVSDHCTNQAEDTTYVTLNNAVADAGADQGICFSDTAYLSCNVGAAYLWTATPPDPSLNGQENKRNIAVSPSSTTVYTVSVENSCGFSASDDVSVTVTPLPNADAGPNGAVCFGLSYQLNASGGTHYQWSSVPNDPSLFVNGQDTLSNPLVTPPTQEPYRYFVQVWDQCTNADSMVLQVDPVPDVTVAADNDFLCFGQSATLTATGTGADFAWASDPYDLSLNGQETNAVITVTPDTTTVYTLTAVVSGFNCPATLKQTITVKPEVTSTFQLQDFSTCQGETFSIAYTGNAGSSATYDWNFDGGQILAGSGQGPYDVSWDTEGSKTITLSVTEEGCPGEPSSQSVEVLQSPQPLFEADNLEGCDPLTVTFANNSTNLSNDVTYLWSFGNGDESSDQNPSHTFTGPGTYTISLTVTNDGLCSNINTQNSYIVVYETPVAEFDADPMETVLEASTIKFTNSSTGNDQLNYHWDFGDGTTSDQKDPSHTYSETGTFTVVLTTGTDNGCESEMQKEVIVHPDFAVYAPTAFTPNGDGLNDKFEVKGVGIKQFKIQIFSRWGDLIFEADNLEDYWDGRGPDGKLVPPGTYVYTIFYRSMLDRDYTKKGTVTVMY